MWISKKKYDELINEREVWRELIKALWSDHIMYVHRESLQNISNADYFNNDKDLAYRFNRTNRSSLNRYVDLLEENNVFDNETCNNERRHIERIFKTLCGGN